MSVTNLKYLEKRWLKKTPAKRGFANFLSWSDAERAKLLRHHLDTDDGINDLETRLRDDFDYLLGFYAIIEIAMMIGFVTELPVAFQKKHLRVLRHPAARQYYEWNYPQDLPRRFRERLFSRVAYAIDPDPKLNSVFYRFLELTKVIECDEDVESFLWTLDGGGRSDEGGTCNVRTVQQRLLDPAKVAHSLQLIPENRYEIDAAVVGFCKFIQFCEEFDSLLQSLRSEPELCEAFWLAHAYWFRQLKSRFKTGLSGAIAMVSGWNVSEEERPALKTRTEELQSLVSRLSNPPQLQRKQKEDVQKESMYLSLEELEKVMQGIELPKTGIVAKTYKQLMNIPVFGFSENVYPLVHAQQISAKNIVGDVISKYSKLQIGGGKSKGIYSSVFTPKSKKKQPA